MFDKSCFFTKGGGCTEGKCDPCKYPSDACVNGKICVADEYGNQVKALKVNGAFI